MKASRTWWAVARQSFAEKAERRGLLPDIGRSFPLDISSPRHQSAHPTTATSTMSTILEPLQLSTPTDSRRKDGCLFCGTPLEHTFVDLGKSPLCESYLSAEQLDGME